MTRQRDRGEAPRGDDRGNLAHTAAFGDLACRSCATVLVKAYWPHLVAKAPPVSTVLMCSTCGAHNVVGAVSSTISAAPAG